MEITCIYTWKIEPAHGHPASFVKSAEAGPRQLKCWRFNRHQGIGRKNRESSNHTGMLVYLDEF